jgi:DNA end-binding protein Ku
MQRMKKRARSKSRAPRSSKVPFHAFWSGSLSFGLVNVPVLIFPASRQHGVRLRLMSADGSTLERRFFCPRDGKEVSDHEIIRGYELEDGSYVVVSDRELEGIEPEKTREIDLRQFVDIADLPPALLERGYYLTPLKEATRAYRLLADAMERTGRAGIATFVMREREYLVAIFSRGGILCAETLRFDDEIRHPQSIGLPEPTPSARARLTAYRRSIDALFSKTLPKSELVDRTTQSLRAMIERKKKAGRDLVRMPDRADDHDAAENGDVDLLETIRQSLRHASKNGDARASHAAASSNGGHARRKQKSSRSRKS